MGKPTLEEALEGIDTRIRHMLEYVQYKYICGVFDFKANALDIM